jgi:predicted DNA-binding protein
MKHTRIRRESRRLNPDAEGMANGLHLRLPDVLRARLEAESARRGVSKGWIVRDALAEHLAALESERLAS